MVQLPTIVEFVANNVELLTETAADDADAAAPEEVAEDVAADPKLDAVEVRANSSASVHQG